MKLGSADDGGWCQSVGGHRCKMGCARWVREMGCARWAREMRGLWPCE